MNGTSSATDQGVKLHGTHGAKGYGRPRSCWGEYTGNLTRGIADGIR